MLRLYNKSFVYMYGLQFYDTLQVIKRYTGKTQLTITFAEQDDAVHFIERDGWIVLEDGEPFVIRHIEQTDETVTVTAYGGHALLEQRITLPAAGKYAVEATGSADEVVKAFINASLRGLPLATAAAQGGTSISEQSRLKPLADEVQRVLIGAGRGEKFTMDADNARIVFDTYLGTDRTRGNIEDNPPVVFGVKYKNIEGYKYREDVTLLQSTIYVGGAGEGAEREIVVVGDAATGIDRVERFVDARDVDAGDTALLAARGGQAVIPVQEVAEITALSDANLVYGVDYELGDIVTALIERKTYEQVGDYFNPVTTELAINQRITEVCITRTGDGAEYVDLRFGEQPITQTQLQALHAEVAQLKSVEGGSGSGSGIVHEVPTGGDAGQVLKKLTGDDYDVAWAADEDSGGDVIAPATHASGRVPVWDGKDTKTLGEGKELSGADDKIITGTPGTNGQLAIYNGDGDIVGISVAAIAGIMRKIASAIVAGSNTTYLEITGLDYSQTGPWKILIIAYGTSSTNDLSLYVNGDTSGSGYANQTARDGTVYDYSNQAYIGYINAADGLNVSEALLVYDATEDDLLIQAHGTRRANESTMTAALYSTRKAGTGNITSLRLYSSDANGLKIGTRMYVFSLT